MRVVSIVESSSADPRLREDLEQLAPTSQLPDAGVNSNDIWIAATAAAHEIPVVTRDGDFQALSGVAGLTVIEV